MVVTGSLEKHLKAVTSKVLLEKSLDPVESFQIINRRLITGSSDSLDASRVDQAQVSKQEEYFSRLTSLLNPPANPEDKEPLKLCSVPNIEQELGIIRATGAGFSLEESFTLSVSLRKLAAEATGMSSVRLWGKILCRSDRDFVIAEAQPESPEDPPEGSDEDGLGTGVNTFAYYASTDYVTWSRLPNASPKHLKASRLIQYILTGSLEASVETFPLFPGTEANLLRSLIARISGSTILAPRGFYSLDDEGNVTTTEEYKYPLATDLVTCNDWVYARKYILANGKTSYPHLPEEDNPETAELILKLKREMNAEPLPKPITQIADNSSKWSIRKYWDVSAIVAVRSKDWPGAVNVLQGSHFFHFYCGYGLKATDKYFIAAPVDIQREEGDELEEQPEPHLLPPPVVADEAVTAN